MFLFVRQKTSLEVAPVWVFGTHACSGEVRGTDKGCPAIHDNRLGMNAWAKNTFKELIFNQRRIAVKVLTETGPGFLGVEQPDGNTPLYQVGKDFQKGDKSPSFGDMHILEIGRHNPEKLLGRGHKLTNHFGVNVFIENKFGQGREDGEMNKCNVSSIIAAVNTKNSRWLLRLHQPASVLNRRTSLPAQRIGWLGSVFPYKGTGP